MSHACAMITTAVVALALNASTGTTRTWQVPGFVPTIPAAMDSASTGDSIVVAPGIYHFWQLHVKNGVVLTSERGPFETEITPMPPPILGPFHGALYCNEITDYTEISGFYIHGFNPGLVGNFSSTIWIDASQNVCIKNNILGASAYAINISTFGFNITIEDNTLFEGGLSITGSTGAIDVRRNIVWGLAIIEVNATLTCNDFYDTQYIVPWLLAPDNFSADPLFCTMHSGAMMYGIRPESPCAPDNSGGCGLVGVDGFICGTTPTRSTNWGRVKSIYR